MAISPPVVVSERRDCRALLAMTGVLESVVMSSDSHRKHDDEHEYD